MDGTKKNNLLLRGLFSLLAADQVYSLWQLLQNNEQSSSGKIILVICKILMLGFFLSMVERKDISFYKGT